MTTALTKLKLYIHQVHCHKTNTDDNYRSPNIDSTKYNTEAFISNFVRLTMKSIEKFN
jgi:hypothetical protein